MKIIDATRDRATPLWKRLRGQFRGAVNRALASSAPADTWKQSLPSLRAAARRAVRATLVLELRRNGRDPDGAWLDELQAARTEGEELTALTMGPARGPRAKGWGELLAKWKIDQPTAWRYMELAGYVAEEVSCNVNETVPTYAEAGITKPRSLSPDLNGKSYYDAAVETARFPHEWDDVKSLAEKPWAHDLIPDAATERPLFHQEAQRRLPPPVEEREDRTVRLRAFWDRVYVDAKKLDVHLTDATASVDDFHSTKNTLIAIANLVLEELERAGVLTAEGQQKQRLLILDGGKGK